MKDKAVSEAVNRVATSKSDAFLKAQSFIKKRMVASSTTQTPLKKHTIPVRLCQTSDKKKELV